MCIELLFENRKLIGENILNLIKDNGHTKSSFSMITNISRPTLNRLINGENDSFATFKTQIQKILDSQKMSSEQLLNYTPKYKKKEDFVIAQSDNSPEYHTMNSNAQEMSDVLRDIAHLCELYYN